MDLALNTSTWDLDLKNGDLYLVQNVDDVVQYLGQKLKLFLGEWIRDQSAGIPYFDAIYVKGADPKVIDAIFKEAVLSTPGVVSIDTWSLTMDSAARNINLTFSGRSESGAIYFSQNLGG